MQARTYRDLKTFDTSVAMLRDYIGRLEQEAANAKGGKQ
jgi:hypothetical protein